MDASEKRARETIALAESYATKYGTGSERVGATCPYDPKEFGTLRDLCTDYFTTPNGIFFWKSGQWSIQMERKK